ncbi:unnamed protein product [Mycena citricolor]|uniref:Uncharacterized protein n=1 Tax=Mycena citricolor TaxID=2018698 RepID=A0AAD2GYC0_9AGAR|nr:unnamed protein product [Mycena citricolor]
MRIARGKLSQKHTFDGLDLERLDILKLALGDAVAVKVDARRRPSVPLPEHGQRTGDHFLEGFGLDDLEAGRLDPGRCTISRAKLVERPDDTGDGNARRARAGVVDVGAEYHDRDTACFLQCGRVGP